MTVQAAKRKRFEGFSQFQAPLRQALVCLQAGLEGRFATAAQLELLKQRDESGHSHFLLSGQPLAAAPDLKNPASGQTLVRISSFENAVLLPCTDSKISAWLDDRDALSSQILAQLMAQAVQSQKTFCLKEVLPWGSTRWNWLPNSSSDLQWLGNERMKLLQNFYRDAAPLFESVRAATLISDGCSLSLVIEGRAKSDWQQTQKQGLIALPCAERHLVAMHGNGRQQSRELQCALTAPLRLPEKGLEIPTLKGLLLIRDIKEAAETLSNVLAS